MKLKKIENSNNLWDFIPDSIKKLHELFQNNGKKLYLVGGCVRDFLTGDTPHDFDLATDALPDDILRILQGKYKINLQGKAFGVVVVYTKDQPSGIEIASFRRDISKGRNPEVELGVTIEQDVNRRDITYNALFYDLDKKQIVDLTGGESDLKTGVTKMVGDPYERIDEDSLRILRAFRFASRYNHPLHQDTELAIKKRKKLENIDPDTGEMKRISQERIWEEIKKSWTQAKDFNYYLNFFTKFDMWDEIFPGAEINTDLIKSNNFIIILANLFRKNKNSDFLIKMIQDYKIESDLAIKVYFLISFLDFKSDNVYETYKKKLQSNISNDTILEWIKVNNIQDDKFVNFVNYKPTILASDLINKGFKGADLGKEIKRLETEKFKKTLKK
jgi:tRNA nucleotidyltransferase/poly(A) polymerase